MTFFFLLFLLLLVLLLCTYCLQCFAHAHKHWFTYALVNVCKQQTGNRTGRYSACVISSSVSFSVCMHACIRIISIHSWFLSWLNAFSAVCMRMFCGFILVCVSARFQCTIFMQCIFVELAKPAFDHVLCGKCRCWIDKRRQNRSTSNVCVNVQPCNGYVLCECVYLCSFCCYLNCCCYCCSHCCCSLLTVIVIVCMDFCCMRYVFLVLIPSSLHLFHLCVCIRFCA